MSVPRDLSEGRPTRALTLVSGVVASLVLSGCSASLPDGTTLWKNESEASIRSKLGAPDVVEQRSTNIGNVVFKDFQTVDCLYYFDRGYVMILHEGRLTNFRPIRPDEQPMVQQRDAARREALAVVPLGTSAAEVIGRLGSPDLVHVEVRKGLVFVQPYLGLEQLAPGVYSQTCFFLTRSVVVQFRDLQAIGVFPLDDERREYYAAEAGRARASRERGDRDPPRAGMTPDEVGERWHCHVVSAQLKDGEYMTLPTQDPAARLGHEVNCWYCLGRRQVVNFSDGRVTSIEPLEGEQEAAVRSFWIRTVDATGPKIPVERLR